VHFKKNTTGPRKFIGLGGGLLQKSVELAFQGKRDVDVRIASGCVGSDRNKLFSTGECGEEFQDASPSGENVLVDETIRGT
jgi:hypothetical protein